LTAGVVFDAVVVERNFALGHLQAVDLGHVGVKPHDPSQR
jgi:hypothetical protein